MRRTQANRYALASVVVAAILIIAVLGVYLRRSQQAAEAKKNSPPSVPASIERSSEGFTYTSYGAQNAPGSRDHVVFVVHASSATTFKGAPNASSLKDAEKNVLLNVQGTVYGRNEDRNDNIHTNSCDFYQQESDKNSNTKSQKSSDRGNMICSGEVLMDLQSAKDAKRGGSPQPGGVSDPRIIHVVTKGVTFDIGSADGHTDQRVDFQFSGGKGTAIGADYNGDDGTLQLLHDVHLSLNATPPQSAKNQSKTSSAPIPVDVVGSSLIFRRDEKTAILHGPVIVTQVTAAPSANAAVNGAAAARTGSHILHASLLTVDMDAQLRAKKLTADGDAKSRPNVVFNSPKGAGTITADKFVTDLDVDGTAKHFSAQGNVQGDFTSVKSGEVDHLSAARVDADMVPKINQPRLVTATGGVKMNSVREGRIRSLETASAEINFVPGVPSHPGAPPSYHADRARTLATATMITREPVAGTNQVTVTRATGQQMEVGFDERNRMRRLLAHNGTQLDRDIPGRPHQNSTSQELVADFDTKGQWTTVDQSGNVHFQSADDRSGQAAKSHVDRATNVETLTGSAEASDAASHTTADTIVFNQTTNEIRADGHVVTTYRKPPDGTTASPASATTIGTPLSLGPDPANIMSEHLVGNSVNGHAIYTGHARMWQGDSTMEADEIELDRDNRQLDARGNVRAVFIQVGASPVEKPAAAPPPHPPQHPPQHPAASAKGGKTAKPPVTNAKPPAPQPSTAKQTPAPAPTGPDVIRLHAATLTYWDAKSQAHMEGGCTAESRDGTITGQSCDLFFAPSTKPEGSAAIASAPQTAAKAPSGTPQTAPGATQRLDHAIFIGNVIVHSEDRRAVGERGEYDSASSKFVISGGKPTLYDGSGTSTTGRQLTFLIADDTILVESEEGTRTLTRYQVKK
jgi:lipopolysaccharide export system protein LptA